VRPGSFVCRLRLRTVHVQTHHRPGSQAGHEARWDGNERHTVFVCDARPVFRCDARHSAKPHREARFKNQVSADMRRMPPPTNVGPRSACFTLKQGKAGLGGDGRNRDVSGCRGVPVRPRAHPIRAGVAGAMLGRVRGLFFTRDGVAGEDRWRSVNGTFGVASLIVGAEQPRPVPPGVVEALAASCESRGVERYAAISERNFGSPTDGDELSPVLLVRKHSGSREGD
jgi:hypothetical protein